MSRPIHQQSWLPAKPVLEWKSIVGLVAELDSSEAVWRGVQSKSLAAVTDSPRRFRALAESWGEATTPNGLRIVLTDSADATVQLGGGTDAPMQITLVQGNLSVGGLQPEESLALRVGNWELELQAAAEETEIAVEASEERPQLFVKTGSVRLGDQTVTAPSRVTSGRRGDLFIASARRLPDWASEPGQIDRTRLALLEPLVSEPDLVTALVGENSESATAASRDRSLLALAIDPARALPQMAESPDATTRTTAVEWLLNAPVDEPQADVAWRSLQPSLATTNLRVHAWIAAVQRGSAANRLELYQELATGIGPGEPLFVRQTAIHLLRGLTGQRFANYDRRHHRRRPFGTCDSRSASTSPAATCRGRRRHVHGALRETIVRDLVATSVRVARFGGGRPWSRSSTTRARWPL